MKNFTTVNDIERNNLVTFILKDGYKVSGFVLDYSENWVLLQYNPVDYIIDGYVAIKVAEIGEMFHSEDGEFTEKVIRLKKTPSRY